MTKRRYKKISDTTEMWKRKLSEGDFKQLEDLLDLRCKSGSIECTASFMYGFKLEISNND